MLLTALAFSSSSLILRFANGFPVLGSLDSLLNPLTYLPSTIPDIPNIPPPPQFPPPQLPTPALLQNSPPQQSSSSSSPTQSPVLAETQPFLPAPLIIFLIFAFGLSPPLLFLSQRFPRWTTSAAYGMTFSGLVWILVLNLVLKTDPSSNQSASNSNSYANVLAVILALLCFFFAYFISYLRLYRGWGKRIGVGLMVVLGGMSFGLSLILSRDGLLIPGFVGDWILVGLVMAIFLMLLYRYPRFMMILSTVQIGIFLLVIASFTAATWSQSFIIGLHIMFHTHSDSSSTESNFQPSLTARLLSGVTPLISLVLSALFFRFSPLSFREDWAWNSKPPKTMKPSLESTKSKPLSFTRSSQMLRSEAFRPLSFHVSPPPASMYNDRESSKDTRSVYTATSSGFTSSEPGIDTIYEAYESEMLGNNKRKSRRTSNRSSRFSKMSRSSYGTSANWNIAEPMPELPQRPKSTYRVVDKAMLSMPSSFGIPSGPEPASRFSMSTNG